MASPHVHYALGLLIARLLGYKGKRSFKLGIFAIIADLDIATVLLMELLLLFVKIDHETYLWFTYLFGHREFLHSILFAFIVTGIATAYVRRWKYGAGVGLMMLSHIILDCATTWGIRVFFPFSLAKCAFNTIAFFDPVFNIGSVIIIAGFVLYQVLKWERFKKRYGEKLKNFRQAFPKIVRYTFVFLCVYLLLLGLAKGIALHSRGDWDDLEFVEAVPNGFYQYVYCVDYNETHWKVVDYGMLSGNEDILYIEKIQISVDDASEIEAMNLTVSRVVDRCEELAKGDHNQIMKYFTYKIKVDGDGVIEVNVFDARREGASTRITQSTGFIFEFRDGDLRDFKAYLDTHGYGQEEVPSFRFE
jgi:inner membrane protein